MQGLLLWPLTGLFDWNDWSDGTSAERFDPLVWILSYLILALPWTAAAAVIYGIFFDPAFVWRSSVGLAVTLALYGLWPSLLEFAEFLIETLRGERLILDDDDNVS